jgi:general secretion pathway protein I
MTGRHAEDGFSLIEMMAALAVLAIAGLALVNMTSATTRNAAAVQERALAAIAAENILNREILRGTRPQSGSGEYALGGTDYAWELAVSQTGDAGLLRLHLVVRAAGSEQIAAELDTFRRPHG